MKSSYSINNSSIFYNNPLFSTIVSLYILILFYFPHFFLKLIPSPLLISILIILLFLLRFGTSQQIKTGKPEPGPNPEETSQIRLELKTQSLTELEFEPTIKLHPCKLEAKPRPNNEVDSKQPDPINNPTSYYEAWVPWTPLEVIFEAYEGEECEDENENDSFFCNENKNPSLLRDYPESELESDTDTGSSSCSSNDDFVEIQEEGMFEISVEDYGFDDKRGDLVNKLKKEIEFDEDNLIEIDISPYNSECGFNW